MRTLAAHCILVALLWGQQAPSSWQQEVRREAEKQNWNAAFQIVERELGRTPQNLEARAWRARLLLWSGRLMEAREEYLAILACNAKDPDTWLGLATVDSRRGQTKQAIDALDHALSLDPRRADIHAARGRELRAQNKIREARLEFQRALEFDSASQEARSGLASLHTEAGHELRIGSETDFFNFMGASQNQGLDLLSRWTPHFRTNVGFAAYRTAGIDAQKFSAGITGRSARWGALTLGGAAAHDHDIIPRSEFLIDYDRGGKFGFNPIRGLEIGYSQHWYWYSGAQILTLNESATLYFPRGWTYSLGLTEARSQFSGTGAEWRPSGTGKLGFPILGGPEGHLAGSLLFAAGTENFAQVDQIGRFSSQTYGGGLRLRLTANQDVRVSAAYQKRSLDRNEISLGLNYGIRF